MTTQQAEFVGSKIRRLRESRKLSMVDVRRLVGVSETTLHRAEVGGVVTPRTAVLLGRLLEIAPEELLP
jgi:DNA-binding transcriptional regulator YiaG